MSSIGMDAFVDLLKEKIDCEAIGLEVRHITPILKILFEEILIDIRNGGFDILGFGRFEIRQLKDHGHNDINNHGQWIVSKGLKKLRVVLEEDLKALLLEHLSRRKTFPPPLDKLLVDD